MHIYVNNFSAKFHPNLIWNEGALSFFWRGRPKNNNNKNKLSSILYYVAVVS